MIDYMFVEAAEAERNGDKRRCNQIILEALNKLDDSSKEIPNFPSIASLLLRWLKLTPAVDLDQCFFLLGARRALHSILEVEGIDLAIALQETLGFTGKLAGLGSSQRKKLAIFDRANLDFNLTPNDFRNLSPQDGVLHAIAMLSDAPESTISLRRFNIAVRQISTWEAVNLPYRYLVGIAHATFMSAYSTLPNKWDAKRFWLM